MTYLFRPPTVKWGPLSPDRLGIHYTSDYGVTVYKAAGVWHQAQILSQSDQIAADVVYMGGHEHLVDDATASSLIDAGYGLSLTLVAGDGVAGITAPPAVAPSGWGVGGWGSQGWGV